MRPGFAALLILSALASIAGRAGEISIVAPDYPPFATVRDGVPSGPMIDIIRDLARRVGLPDKVAVRPGLRWRREMLEDDRLTPFVTRTPDREGSFSWIAPVYRDCARFATVGDHPAVTSLEQGKSLGRVAAVSAGSSREFLDRQGFDNIKSVDDERQTALELINGRVDAWFGLCTNQALFLPKMTAVPIHFGPSFLSMDLWIAGSKTLPQDLVRRLRAAFGDMRESGELDRYLSVLPPPAEPVSR